MITFPSKLLALFFSHWKQQREFEDIFRYNSFVRLVRSSAIFIYLRKIIHSNREKELYPPIDFKARYYLLQVIRVHTRSDGINITGWSRIRFLESNSFDVGRDMEGVRIGGGGKEEGKLVTRAEESGRKTRWYFFPQRGVPRGDAHIDEI